MSWASDPFAAQYSDGVVVLTLSVEPPNKGHYGVNYFVTCREVVPISEGQIIHQSINMGLKQVSFVERSSLSQRIPYWRFHYITLEEKKVAKTIYWTLPVGILQRVMHRKEYNH